MCVTARPHELLSIGLSISFLFPSRNSDGHLPKDTGDRQTKIENGPKTRDIWTLFPPGCAVGWLDDDLFPTRISRLAIIINWGWDWEAFLVFPSFEFILIGPSSPEPLIGWSCGGQTTWRHQKKKQIPPVFLHSLISNWIRRRGTKKKLIAHSLGLISLFFFLYLCYITFSRIPPPCINSSCPLDGCRQTSWYGRHIFRLWLGKLKYLSL